MRIGGRHYPTATVQAPIEYVSPNVPPASTMIPTPTAGRFTGLVIRRFQHRKGPPAKSYASGNRHTGGAPNHLRHAAATEVHREFGLEAAQVILSHSQANVTQVYAERDIAKGMEVARLIG